MFFYKGGQKVRKGTYWESEKNEKIILGEEGVLPGTGKVTYFKLPESYLLIPAFLLLLGMSMAMPYGVGFVLFFCLVALVGAFYAAGSATYKLLRELLGRNAQFGYSPATSYLAGKKTKKTRKDMDLHKEEDR